MEATTKKETKPIRIIYNNDCEVLDYLADLHDRAPLRQLQRFLDYSRREPHCILANCPLDGVVVLIVYKTPLQFNEKPNDFILFIHPSLHELCKYFKRWVDNEPDREIRKSLDDILHLLYFQWAQSQDEETDKSFLG